MSLEAVDSMRASAKSPAVRPSLAIPKIAGEFVHIYRPGADVYSLPTAVTTCGNIIYREGANYPDWRVNDHTFIRDDDGRWHCFGITKPWISGDNSHSAEGLCFHAMAPEGTFDETIRFQSWRDLPKISVGDCGWAPHALRLDQSYALVGSHLGLAVSADLREWTDMGRLNAQGGIRDPYITLIGGAYWLLRCAGNGISVAVSTDFVHWTDPQLIYQPEPVGYETESPVLVHRDGLYYLFWTLWDRADLTTYGYCPRTFVHCSDDPMDFHGKPVLAEYTVHAPEIIHDEKGNWFMSSADFPHRGISIAPLTWEPLSPRVGGCVPGVAGR